MNIGQNQLELIKDQLATMNQLGGFSLSVLLDQEGLPLIWVCQDPHVPERYSAAVALLNRTLNQIQTQFSWSNIDEIVITGEHGGQLVCRSTTIAQQVLTLAVVSSKHQSYRRTMNQMLRVIDSLLAPQLT